MKVKRVKDIIIALVKEKDKNLLIDFKDSLLKMIKLPTIR